ncbi:unnamed protein product [Prorocentrum cordatum]|uniref:Uncharacterized protein n=1 Tax=Prorocentrum cordatum TaxID=2364126 RepID=A0ABN9V6V1_9DINO|nr:unnamed protein product [Polarella glacialis]
MGRVSDSVSYKVKNTFVEFGQADEVGYERVRARSDGTELNRGLLRGPQSPEEFAEFQAAQKARVVVPDTPSPFLHPSIPEHRGDMPLLSLAEPAAGHEVSAFGDIGPEELYGPGGAECFDAGDLPGFCYFPVPGMFDPSTGEFSAGGWYMSADGMGAELQALAESGWGPEGGVQMEAGPAAEAPFGGGSSAQGWGPDGGVQAEEEQGQAAPAAEAAGGAEAWRQDAALQGPGDGRAWGKGGGQAEKEPASHEDGAWEEGRAGPAWGRKGGRGPRRQAQANGEARPSWRAAARLPAAARRRTGASPRSCSATSRTSTLGRCW